jgi:hypothetical protein
MVHLIDGGKEKDLENKTAQQPASIYAAGRRAVCLPIGRRLT